VPQGLGDLCVAHAGGTHLDRSLTLLLGSSPTWLKRVETHVLCATEDDEVVWVVVQSVAVDVVDNLV
jgi:hypothetical protein